VQQVMHALVRVHVLVIQQVARKMVRLACCVRRAQLLVRMAGTVGGY
jgi:hypothetical protein